MLNTNKFKGNVSFPKIELNVPGLYSIEYYYHFNCKISSCLNSEVSMTIFFDYENNKTSIKHDIKNAKERDATWVKNALNITTTMKNNLKVLLLL
jgi:hypothetical protein